MKYIKTTFEAISTAQSIAFAPLLFLTPIALRAFGNSKLVNKRSEDGLTLQKTHAKINVTTYSTKVLLKTILDIGLVIRNDDKVSMEPIQAFQLNHLRIINL